MLRSSFILPFDKLRTGYLPLMVSLSNHARLACGAFYGACPEFAEGPSNLACFSTFHEFITI